MNIALILAMDIINRENNRDSNELSYIRFPNRFKPILNNVE